MHGAHCRPSKVAEMTGRTNRVVRLFLPDPLLVRLLVRLLVWLPFRAPPLKIYVFPNIISKPTKKKESGKTK
jgi:hypothetical protein